MITDEVWKPIKNFENLYEVSNFGKIKSLERKIDNGYNVRTHSEKILKNYIDSKGYCKYFLYKNGKRYSNRIHRLVAITYLENNDNKPEVNHKDGNKLNNHYINLEWVTTKENINHAFKTKLKIALKGENHSQHKLLESDVLEIRKLKGCYTQKILGEMYNISQREICDILNNKLWKHLL